MCSASVRLSANSPSPRVYCNIIVTLLWLYVNTKLIWKVNRGHSVPGYMYTARVADIIIVLNTIVSIIVSSVSMQAHFQIIFPQINVFSPSINDTYVSYNVKRLWSLI